MQAKILLPIEKLFSRIYHYFHQKNLLILIGKYGASISCYRRGVLVEFRFFSNSSATKIEQIKIFLSKYKNYHISFLLDMPEISLRLEILPQIQVFIKNNPGRRYIHEHYKNDDIVAYNITEIEKNKNSEIWHLQVASCQYTRPIISIVEFIINKSLKFNGFYFMPLEVNNIVKYLEDKTGETIKTTRKLKVLLFSNQTSHCRLFAVYHGEVVGQRQFLYPDDKNDSYINGLLEQHVEELLNSLKDLIEEYKLECELNVICRDEKDQAFREIIIKNCKVNIHCHKPQNILDSKRVKHSDHYMAYLFNRVKHNQGAKHNLHMITMLNYVGSFLSIPFIIMMIIMASFISFTKYQTYNITKEIKAINQNYVDLGQKFRNIKDGFPKINEDNLANYILAKNILTRRAFSAEEIIIKLKKLKNSDNILLNKASWRINANNCFYIGYCLQEDIHLSLFYDSINFNSKNVSIEKDIQDLYQQLRQIYPGFKISILNAESNQNITDNKLLIPIKINLTRGNIHNAK